MKWFVTALPALEQWELLVMSSTNIDTTNSQAAPALALLQTFLAKLGLRPCLGKGQGLEAAIRAVNSHIHITKSLVLNLPSPVKYPR